MQNKKTNKLRKGTLVSLLTIALATTVGAYGTFAYFNDTEQSTSNLFSAGTLDLSLGATGGQVDSFIAADNFAPGDSISGNLTLYNDGSISSYDGDGHTVSLSMSTLLTQTDADNATTDMASYLEITQLDYDGTSILSSVSNGNGNAYTDLADLEAATLSGLVDPGAAGKDLVMTVAFHTDAGNDLQGDAVNAAFTFTLAQS